MMPTNAPKRWKKPPLYMVGLNPERILQGLVQLQYQQTGTDIQQLNPSTSKPTQLFNSSTFQPFNSSTNKQWPYLFTTSDTTGEKDFEEFFTEKETLDIDRFQNLGIIKNQLENFDVPIDYFEHTIHSMKESKSWTKQEIVDLFHYMLPDFEHKETGKYLDAKM